MITITYIPPVSVSANVYVIGSIISILPCILWKMIVDNNILSHVSIVNDMPQLIAQLTASRSYSFALEYVYGHN